MEKEKEAQVDIEEEPKEWQEMTQETTEKVVNRKWKSAKLPSLLAKGEARASNKHEIKQSVSSKGQAVKQRKRKLVDDTRDKEKKKKQETENEKEGEEQCRLQSQELNEL